MSFIEANGQQIELKKGDTILQALKRGGIHVPTICHMEGLIPSGTCRMCVVEVEGMGGLVPSCSYPAAEGMKIKTNTPTILKTRKQIVERWRLEKKDPAAAVSEPKEPITFWLDKNIPEKYRKSVYLDAKVDGRAEFYDNIALAPDELVTYYVTVPAKANYRIVLYNSTAGKANGNDLYVELW